MRARKSALLLVVSLIRSGLGLISTLVVARFMGPTALGTITYLFGLVGLLAIVSDLGFSVAHLKRASEPTADLGACTGTFLTVKLGLCLVLLLVILGTPSVSKALGRPVVEGVEQTLAYYLIALVPLLNNLSQVALYTFEARQESARQSMATFLGGVATAIARIMVAVLGLGLVALSLAYSMEAIVVFIAAILLFRGYPLGRPRRETWIGYSQYAMPVLATTILSTITLNVSPVMIERLGNVTEVGYYGSVLGIATLIGRFSSAAMVVFFPQASEDAYLGQLDEIQRRLFVIERHLLNLTVPLAVLTMYFSPQIVNWVLGPDFLPAASVLAVLIVDAVITTFFQPYGMAVYAMGKPQYMVRSGLIQLGTLLAGSLILIPQRAGGLGALGAAIAMVIADTMSGLYQVYLTTRLAHIGLYGRWYAYVIAGALSYAVLRVLGSNVAGLSLSPVTPLALALAGWSVCTFCLALFGQLRHGDVRLYIDLVRPMKMWQYIRGELVRGSERIV